MFDVRWLVGYMVILVALSVFDIRKKEIPMWGICLLGMVSLGYLITGSGIIFYDAIMGCVPGMLLIILALLTKEKVGYGDGLVLLFIGLALGFELSMYMLMLALFLNCVMCGALFALHKVGKQTPIPFVPFLTIGMGIVGICF